VKGTSELDRARHVDFSFRHPSSWERNLERHKTDDKLFVDLMTHDGKAAHAFVVRSLRRTALEVPLANYLHATLEPQQVGLASGETLDVLSFAPVRAGGVDGHEVAYVQSGPRGKTWMRILLLPAAETEWGTLMVRMTVGSVDPTTDVVGIAGRSALNGMLDSLTLTPPK
jgi:hypothetical protein